MKNTIKFLGIIAIVAVIGFGVVSCGGDDDDKGGNNNNIIAPLVEMVQVAGGSFQMGKELGASGDDITPVHGVTLADFYMGKYPVTQEQYQAVMGNNPSDFNGATGKEPAEGETQGKRPVEGVTWYDAVEFCNKLSEREGLQPVYVISGRTPATGYPITGATVMAGWGQNGYRLPTEAQWEYAAKGGSSQQSNSYAGSANIQNVAWYVGNSGNKTHEVGKKTANRLGLFDMSGNVWELCWDWSGDYSDGTQTNPIGPDTGTTRVMRGGCWSDEAATVHIVFRGSTAPNLMTSSVGFRIVRPL